MLEVSDSYDSAVSVRNLMRKQQKKLKRISDPENEDKLKLLSHYLQIANDFIKSFNPENSTHTEEQPI